MGGFTLHGPNYKIKKINNTSNRCRCPGFIRDIPGYIEDVLVGKNDNCITRNEFYSLLDPPQHAHTDDGYFEYEYKYQVTPHSN
jgi:aspartate carbamoyltransferase regulatory subunit